MVPLENADPSRSLNWRILETEESGPTYDVYS